MRREGSTGVYFSLGTVPNAGIERSKQASLQPGLGTLLGDHCPIAGQNRRCRPVDAGPGQWYGDPACGSESVGIRLQGSLR